MKILFQFLVAFGVLHLIVTIFEFAFNPKVSGSIVLAPLLLIIGFVGLFISNRKGKK